MTVKLGIFGGVTPQGDEAFKALVTKYVGSGNVEFIHIPPDRDQNRPRKADALATPKAMTSLVQSLKRDIDALNESSLLVMPCSTVYRPEILSKLDLKDRLIDLGGP